MSHRVRAAALAAAVSLGSLVVAGCSSSGLSPREVQGRSQSTLLNSLYDPAGLGGPAGVREPVRPPRLPASLAVAQVGEVAPPRPMIDALGKDPMVFARVVALPAAEQIAPVYQFHRDMDNSARAAEMANAQSSASRRSVDALRRLAADAGADHLLLVGGTVDYGTASTPLALFDLTIVGAFAMPSRETRAKATAAGALIDVKTGRVVQISTAEARRQSTVPAVAVQAEQTKLLERLRDDVVTDLAAKVLVDTRARAGAAPAAPAAAAQAGGARYETGAGGDAL